MGYHHIALAARDMKAIHHFYEEVIGFNLVKVEIGPSPEGGWAKHFFYRMEDDSKFIAFWEIHDIPGVDTEFETNISKAAGLPMPTEASSPSTEPSGLQMLVKTLKKLCVYICIF